MERDNAGQEVRLGQAGVSVARSLAVAVGARDVRPAEVMSLLNTVGGVSKANNGKQIIETHTAFIFLTRNSAFKLKKPVKLPYLDFTTPDMRRLVLQEELKVNRKLAGPIYKRLRSLSRGSDGALILDGPGEAIDWLLEMKRLPESKFMNGRLALQGITLEEVHALGTLLCRFYERTERKQGGAEIYLDHLRQETLVNKEHLLSMTPHLKGYLSVPSLQMAADLIDRHAHEIVERGKTSLIVEGHGDLRLEHICLTDPPIIFDRLEFQEDMRQIDIYDEVNYLALETEIYGHGWIGAKLLEIVDRHFNAKPSKPLMMAYGLFRLFLRARLAIDHLLDPFPRQTRKWIGQAQLFLSKANALSMMPC